MITVYGIHAQRKSKKWDVRQSYYCNSCFFSWSWARIFVCTGEVLEWLFEELSKSIKYMDINFEHSNRFILLWFMEFSGTFYGRSNRYTCLQNALTRALVYFGFNLFWFQRLLSFQNNFQLGVAHKSFSYKKTCNGVL